LTANTTIKLRFTPIPESINSHTLVNVKAHKSMNLLNIIYKIHRSPNGSVNHPSWNTTEFMSVTQP